MSSAMQGGAPATAIRSLVISYKLLGTREWFVIHHTDCGMETFTDEIMRKLLGSSLTTAALEKGVWKDTAKGPGSTEAEFLSWLTISNQADSVRADVSRIRNLRSYPNEIPIYGYLYDVKTGRLNEVAEATQIGKVVRR
jgi:carbonic anhydrase